MDFFFSGVQLHFTTDLCKISIIYKNYSKYIFADWNRIAPAPMNIAKSLKGECAEKYESINLVIYSRQNSIISGTTSYRITLGH